MALDRGRIRALIWAPPRNFFVNTPSAVAVDLGCAYTLDVDPRGWGLVHVTSGWVAFEYGGRESFIPQNAVCATRPRFGPGTPHYADASPALVEALSILDFPATENVNRSSALDVVLGASRRARCADAVAPAVARLARRAGPCLRSAQRACCGACRSYARSHPRGRHARRSMRGGTSWDSTARRGGVYGRAPGAIGKRQPIPGVVFADIFVTTMPAAVALVHRRVPRGLRRRTGRSSRAHQPAVDAGREPAAEGASPGVRDPQPRVSRLPFQRHAMALVQQRRRRSRGF